MNAQKMCIFELRGDGFSIFQKLTKLLVIQVVYIYNKLSQFFNKLQNSILGQGFGGGPKRGFWPVGTE